MNADFEPIAGRTGVIYRHSKTGETHYLKNGEKFLERPGPGQWELLFSDNAKKEDVIPILCGKGIFFAFAVDSLPEVGQEFNLRHWSKMGLPTGLYRINGVGEKKWNKKDHFFVEVERIGDMDPRKRIHDADLLNV